MVFKSKAMRVLLFDYSAIGLCRTCRCLIMLKTVGLFNDKKFGRQLFSAISLEKDGHSFLNWPPIGLIYESDLNALRFCAICPPTHVFLSFSCSQSSFASKWKSAYVFIYLFIMPERLNSSFLLAKRTFPVEGCSPLAKSAKNFWRLFLVFFLHRQNSITLTKSRFLPFFDVKKEDESNNKSISGF